MKKLAVLVAVLMLMSAMVGCVVNSGQQSDPAAEPTAASQPGTTQESSAHASSEPIVLRFPLMSEPSSLDPGYGNSSDSICPRGLMYEGLVRIYDNKITPAIAESWEVGEDGVTYTFHLRDTKWADGQTVTAQDFVYGITRLLDPSESAPNGNYQWMGDYIEGGYEFRKGQAGVEVLGVRAVDEKTLEIKAARPMPYFIDLMKMPCFYPVRQDVAEKEGKNYAAGPENVICNGPFILTQWDHESKLVFQKNPGYWNADAINVDTIEAYIISDIETQMSMFDSGELDATVNIPKEYIQQYIDAGTAVRVDGATVWYNVVNTKTDRGEISKLLQNQSFRQAVSYAIDRASMVTAARGDGSVPITRICPDLMGILDTTWGERYPFNPYPESGDGAKAAELFQTALSETGMSADALPDLTLVTFDDPCAKVVAEIIQNVMKKNFNINVIIDTQTYSARVEKENNGDYDFCISNWAPDYNDPMTFLACFQSTDSYNLYFGGYNNPEYDEMIAFCNETVDMEARADKMFEAEQMFSESCTNIPLFQTSGYWAKNPDFEGMTRCGFGANDPDFATIRYIGK